MSPPGFTMTSVPPIGLIVAARTTLIPARRLPIVAPPSPSREYDRNPD